MFFTAETLKTLQNNNFQLDIFPKTFHDSNEKYNYYKIKITNLLLEIQSDILSDIHETMPSDQIEKHIIGFFTKINELKDHTHELFKITSYPSIKNKSFILDKTQDIYNLNDFYWYEPIRKTRNLIMHEGKKPNFIFKNEKLFFNFFYNQLNTNTNIPILWYFNDENNFINFLDFASNALYTFSFIISECNLKNCTFSSDQSQNSCINFNNHFITLIEKSIVKNYSDLEIENYIFFSLFEIYNEYTPTNIKKTRNLIEKIKLDQFKKIRKDYIAALYLLEGNHLVTQDINKAIQSFKIALEYNEDIASITCLIAAYSQLIKTIPNDDNTLSDILNLIAKYKDLAQEQKYILFFTNASEFLSSYDHEYAIEIYEIGLNIIENNKNSFDLLYNYAHFLKNDIHSPQKSIPILKKLLTLDPYDIGAHKMLISIYNNLNMYKERDQHLLDHTVFLKNQKIII